MDQLNTSVESYPTEKIEEIERLMNGLCCSCTKRVGLV